MLLLSFTWFSYITINVFTFINRVFDEHLQVWKISSAIGLLDHINCCQKVQMIDIWFIVQQMVYVPCTTEGHLIGKYPIFQYSLVGSIPMESSSFMPGISEYILSVSATWGTLGTNIVTTKFINLLGRWHGQPVSSQTHH